MMLKAVKDGLLEPVNLDGQPVAAGAFVSRRRAACVFRSNVITDSGGR
jgi:hypothetical protein